LPRLCLFRLHFELPLKLRGACLQLPLHPLGTPPPQLPPPLLHMPHCLRSHKREALLLQRCDASSCLTVATGSL